MSSSEAPPRLVTTHHFSTQGSLKEKTVENLEKYVVKDVSKMSPVESGYVKVLEVGVTHRLNITMSFFPRQAQTSSPPEPHERSGQSLPGHQQ